MPERISVFVESAMPTSTGTSTKPSGTSAPSGMGCALSKVCPSAGRTKTAVPSSVLTTAEEGTVMQSTDWAVVIL